MANLDEAVEFTLGCEVFKNNPGDVKEDEDGRTRFGICEKFHPTLEDDCNFYSCDDETALHIADDVYNKEYWTPIHGDKIDSQYVANRLLSFAVNQSPRQAIVLLQRALGCADDGVVGIQTLAYLNMQSANAESLSLLMNKWRALLVAFYRRVAEVRPSKRKELNGWLARVAK